MKKILLFLLVLSLNVALFGCGNGDNSPQTGGDQNTTGSHQTNEQQQTGGYQQSNESDKDEVTSLVKDFGSKLQQVSLLAPKDELEKSMNENYDEYATPELIAKWISDPQNAPGRLTSSPWPDRIEVISTEEISEDEYEVKGEVIEITSVEKEKGGIAAKRPITLKIKKADSGWQINDVELGDYE